MTRTLGSAIVVWFALSVPPAFATTSGEPGHLPKSRPVQIVDVVGDANAINDQGMDFSGPEGVATPADRASADITSLTFRRTDDGVHIKGISVSLALAAKPEAGTIYIVSAYTPDCTTFQFTYDLLPLDQPAAYLYENCNWQLYGRTGDDCIRLPLVTTIVGGTITWKMSVDDLPYGVAIGTDLEQVHAFTAAHVTNNSNGVSHARLPVWDQTPRIPADYRIGQ